MWKCWQSISKKGYETMNAAGMRTAALGHVKLADRMERREPGMWLLMSLSFLMMIRMMIMMKMKVLWIERRAQIVRMMMMMTTTTTLSGGIREGLVVDDYDYLGCGNTSTMCIDHDENDDFE